MRIVFTIPPRSSQTLSTPRIFIRANPDFWYSPTIAFRSSFHSSSRYLPDPVTQRKIPRSRVVICPRNAFSLNPRFPEKRTSSTWLPRRNGNCGTQVVASVVVGDQPLPQVVHQRPLGDLLVSPQAGDIRKAGRRKRGEPLPTAVT